MEKIEKYNKFIGYSVNQIGDIIGDSEAAQYFDGYLRDIGATFCIEEKNYVDKEFLIDYSKFYARSFDDIRKYTTRLHFFKNPITKEDFYKTLKNYSIKEADGKTFGEKQLSKINDAYLGFLVVKPVIDSNKDPLLGRTLLAPYPHNDGNELREHLKQKYRVSLYGLPLTIESLPFQMQDQSVGACATTACWVSLHALKDLFESPIHSLAEITEKSTTFPSMDRNFPSSGLSVHQIKNYFTSIGLETEYIDMEPHRLKEQLGKSHTVVPTLVKAYVDFGLPIIACLKLVKTVVESGIENYDRIENYDQHAVVISGYRHLNGSIKELYAHDDRIGTYSRVFPVNSNNLFLKWKTKWLEREYTHGKTYKEVVLESVIVPIYPKLRLRFMDMYVLFIDHLEQAKGVERNNRRDTFSYELKLENINNYKKYLLKKTFPNKSKILMRRFPRFIWIIRDSINNKIVNDQIYDATCNYQTSEPFENIKFKIDI